MMVNIHVFQPHQADPMLILDMVCCCKPAYMNLSNQED